MNYETVLAPYITPIFKNGNKSDPDNYRGICVNSNLGKVFCSIINSRLIDFLMKHNVLSKSQIEFIPNHRTSDHIYTLHTLVDKYINQNKTKIFACFIDFKKAFDSIWHIGLLYKLLQSGVGGKAYDIIKSMYTNNMCSIKIGHKRTDFISQERGVRQGCCLSPALFNIYINELASILELSTVPGLTLHNTEIKFLLYADDLILLSPTKEGLQQSLDLLDRYCQTWALAVNLKKTKSMVFQKRPRCLGNTLHFKIGTHKIENCLEYNYLGLKISPTGSFNPAVDELREKARRAFYAIKRQIYIQIPILIWLKLLQAIIEPILLYGSEVWGPQTNQLFDQWEKHSIEIANTEFCKSILQVHRTTTNNACRAELGQYPLLLKIQKRSIKYWLHLKQSDPHSFQHKALQSQEMNRSPLTQLVLRLCPQAGSPSAQPQDQSENISIRLNQIIKHQKQTYLTHWNTKTHTQSKMQCYLALNRQYSVAPYLTTVTDVRHRVLLTKYRLSAHSLAIETGRHKRSWLPKEERLCQQCEEAAVETEQHFLLHCPKFQNVREIYFSKFGQKHPHFINSHVDQLQILMGERKESSVLAGQFISACHKMRR